MSGTEGVHKLCLQEHFEYMVKELMLDGTSLIDELQEDSCLTEGEAYDIRYHKDPKTKIRKLAYAISTRDRQIFDKFLQKLQRDNKHVHDKILHSYHDKMRNGPIASGCLICSIKRDVNIRHVVDKLCSQFIIDLDFVNTMVSYSDQNVPHIQKQFWDNVFSHIDDSEDRIDKLERLQDALRESKYKVLAEKLGRWARPKLICLCRESLSLNLSFNTISDCLSTSTGDLSTTSNIRSKSRISIQSVSSLEDEDASVDPERHDGNLPYTLEWVKSSPATNSGEESSWPLPANQTPTRSVLYVDENSNTRERIASFKSIARCVLLEDSPSQENNGNATIARSLSTPQSDFREGRVSTQTDLSTDERNALAQSSHLGVSLDAAILSKQLVDMINTPLPVVDAYTGRKKVYTKKRHTRTRSDETSNITFDPDRRSTDEHGRLRQINGLIDTCASSISDIFHKNFIPSEAKQAPTSNHTSTFHVKTREVESDGSLGQNGQIQAQTLKALEHLSLHDNTDAGQAEPRVLSLPPDGNLNNPLYVTDQIILTPSKHMNPLMCGTGTREENRHSNKKRKKFKDKRRIRLETY